MAYVIIAILMVVAFSLVLYVDGTRTTRASSWDLDAMNIDYPEKVDQPISMLSIYCQCLTLITRFSQVKRQLGPSISASPNLGDCGN